jgi:hypothetical protein
MSGARAPCPLTTQVHARKHVNACIHNASTRTHTHTQNQQGAACRAAAGGGARTYFFQFNPILFNFNFNRALFAGQLQAECKDVNFEAQILKSQHICGSYKDIDWSTLSHSLL